jgi:glycine cleavage system transcriptional repressor
VAHFAVSAVGADRPGIVAAVTGAFLEAGCNLEDTSMTILRGHFAMMLVVAAPDEVTQGALEASLAGAATGFELVLAVRPLDDTVPESPEGEAWTVSVYGSDRPGIVHRVASLLAERSVNIVDLSTRVIGQARRPVYAMILEVTLPPGCDAGALSRSLSDLAADLGVDCSLHPSEADIL